jgi:hypothetical protein
MQSRRPRGRLDGSLAVEDREDNHRDIGVGGGDLPAPSSLFTSGMRTLVGQARRLQALAWPGWLKTKRLGSAANSSRQAVEQNHHFGHRAIQRAQRKIGDWWHLATNQTQPMPDRTLGPAARGHLALPAQGRTQQSRC